MTVYLKSHLFPSLNCLVGLGCKKACSGTVKLVNIVHYNSNLTITNRYYCNRKIEEQPDVKQLLDNSALFENSDEAESWATSPYPKGVYNPRLQSNHSLRPKVDPRGTSLILFPGEGSQYVGMGHKLIKFPVVQDIFHVANDILKYDILSLCMQGPKSKLDETKYAQVAVMICSLAALERLREERPSIVDSCVATAGIGIGELTALTFAGAISFERAVRLAQLRGEAMQLAGEMEPSGMMTVFYRPDTQLHEVLSRAKEYAAAKGVESPVCGMASYLFPHCKILAGHNQCLEYIEKNYQQLKLLNVRRLNMKGAHHTSLMKPAATAIKKFLWKSNLQDPVIAVHSTLDGKIYHNKDAVVRKLPLQVMKPAKLEQMMHVLYERPDGEHFPQTFECGPGDTLKTIMKKVNAKAYDKCVNIC